MKYEKETLIIYDKHCRVIKERDITNLPYPIQNVIIEIAMSNILLADHYDIVRIKKKSK